MICSTYQCLHPRKNRGEGNLLVTAQGVDFAHDIGTTDLAALQFPYQSVAMFLFALC